MPAMFWYGVYVCKTLDDNIFFLSILQSPRNGDDLSDGEPLETEERSHTPPPRMDSPEENLTPQLKIKVFENHLISTIFNNFILRIFVY